MVAATKNIVITKGIDFYYAFTIQNDDGTPFNATGYTGVAKVRATPDATAVLLTFTVTINSPSAGGPVTVTATSSAINNLSLGIYHWDCVITHATSPDLHLLRGKATVIANAAV